MNVGDLRAVLAHENIPDEAEVRVGVEDLTKPRAYLWGVAYDARYYGKVFWVEGTHPSSPKVDPHTLEPTKDNT